MRERWKYDVLSELVTVINGLWKGKKEPFINVGVIRNANFNKDITLNYSNIEYLDVEERQYKTRKLLSGDLIVEKSGGSEKQPVGRTVLFRGEGEFSVSNFTSILRIKDQNVIIPEFLYKYLLFVYYSGATKAMQKATTGIHNILFDKFLAIQIPIPSIVEQERIVSLLDLEFAKIDAIKANAEKQLQDAKDLFQSKIEDCFSDNSDWDSYNISECFSSINNGANIKQTKGASGLPITRIETLSNGIFNANRLGYADIFDSVKYQKYILNEGDILMSHINSLEFVGRSVAFQNQLPIVIHGMNLLRLVPLSFIDSDFFVYLSKTRNFKKSINGITHKSVNQASFNTTALKAIQIKVPSIETQRQIVDNLNKMQNLCLSLQSNFDTTVTFCNDLKQSILKDIFG